MRTTLAAVGQTPSRRARVARTLPGILFGLCLIGTTGSAAQAAQGQEMSEASQLAVGGRIFRQNCSSCHGATGAGDGQAARYLTPKPRDLTSGLFKFRSTAPGKPPSDTDLERTIAQGIPGTSMPGWERQLGANDIAAVVQYVKSLSERFDGADPGDAIEIGEPPDLGPAAAERGKALYMGLCMACHGPEGDGRGPGSEGLKDGWGHDIRPANFTRGVYKSGSGPKDLFRTVSTGLEGTPMAPWIALQPSQRWDLVAYVRSFSEGRTKYSVGRVPAPPTSTFVESN